MSVRIRKNLAIWLSAAEGWVLSGLSQGEIETTAGHVAERLHRNPSHPLAVFAQALHKKTTTVPNVFSEDGEQVLLDRLSRLSVRVAFDVGANVGKWSAYALRVFPEAEVHAFEIVPETFRLLSESIGANRRAHLHPFGLSDQDGRVLVTLYSSNLIASMFAPDGGRGATGTAECEVRRGAGVAAAEDIPNIDVLKIDTEGAEGRVLAGFEPMLTEQRVRVIQFEYNRGAILDGFLLKHAYEFFEARGYIVGKLAPRGVLFRSYQLAHEDFAGPNYVACRRDDEEMIATIRFRD